MHGMANWRNACRSAGKAGVPYGEDRVGAHFPMEMQTVAIRITERSTSIWSKLGAKLTTSSWISTVAPAIFLSAMARGGGVAGQFKQVWAGLGGLSVAGYEGSAILGEC